VGLYDSDVNFSCMACDTSLNLGSDEKSNSDGLQRKLGMVHSNIKRALEQSSPGKGEAFCRVNRHCERRVPGPSCFFGGFDWGYWEILARESRSTYMIE
jgi:hypothetical protein